MIYNPLYWLLPDCQLIFIVSPGLIDVVIYDLVSVSCGHSLDIYVQTINFLLASSLCVAYRPSVQIGEPVLGGGAVFYSVVMLACGVDCQPTNFILTYNDSPSCRHVVHLHMDMLCTYL